MTRSLTHITVVRNEDDDVPTPRRSFTLDVVEFQPYDPAAYAWCAGWACEATLDDGVTFDCFVCEAGDWYDDENTVIGYAPEIRAQSERFERMLDEAAEHAA